MEIRLESGQLNIPITLSDNELTRAIYEMLPFEASVNTWGKEIYFPMPIKASFSQEKLTQEVKIGDVCVWPQGPCVCIFFGPTPMSTASEPRPYSDVVIVGKVKGNSQRLEGIKPQQKVKLVKL